MIARALRREKDGVLEPPPETNTVVFVDDVHFGEEVGSCWVTEHRGRRRLSDVLSTKTCQIA